MVVMMAAVGGLCGAAAPAAAQCVPRSGGPAGGGCPPDVTARAAVGAESIEPEAAVPAGASRVTCDRLRAEARAEAALLYAPRVQLEGIRAPGALDPARPAGAGGAVAQARLSLALSPIDMLRGHAIESVAAAECARVALADQLDRVLAVGTRHGELAAARDELAYLDGHIAEIDAMVSDGINRFERQRATAAEVEELRERRASLRAHIAELRHRSLVLEQFDGTAEIPREPAELAPRYRAAALEVDRRRADERGLSAWRLDVRAGLAEADQSDWFGVVELAYSFGDPWRRAADREFLRARARELASDPRDASVRWDQLRRAMRRSVDAIELEIRMVDDELAKLRSERDRVAQVADGNDGARQLQARYTINLIELEARRVSLSSLAAARRPLAGGAL